MEGKDLTQDLFYSCENKTCSAPEGEFLKFLNQLNSSI
jgi:hypothetical protein